MKTILILALIAISAISLYGAFGTATRIRDIRRAANVMGTVTNFLLALLNALQGVAAPIQNSQSQSSANPNNVPLRRETGQILDLSI